ncbi:hypothetical protein [Mesorhizobium sophorae]|uniref:hypothetical protein n=1 Tax=Mesorhizobium sophorae TaxID=1300294 RepID=UPI000BA4C3FF|nr:hypothetical protein [Mesorhizobium sophorae]
MTMASKPGKRGRKPKDGAAAMSNAERQRRYRERVRQGVQRGAGEADTEALRRTQEQIAAKAVDTLDPIHGYVLDARYAATDALMWMTGLRDAILAGQDHVRGLSRQVARRVLGVEQILRKLEAALEEQGAAVPAPPSSVDLETLQAILAHSRERLGVANMQVEWLHEGITPDTPGEITGPAWQLRFSIGDWKQTVDFVGAVLDGKGAEVPGHWTRQGKPAAKRRRSGR